MYRLKIADRLAHEGRHAEAIRVLQEMASELPDSLLVQQRLRDLGQRIGRTDLRTAAEDRVRAIRQERRDRFPGLRAGAAIAPAGVLVIDPIFRGSRLYYTAMIAEATQDAVQGGTEVLTREHMDSALFASYGDRLSSATLTAVLKVPEDLWYGAIPAEACRQIAERMACARPGTAVIAAGWNELAAHLPDELLRLRRRLPVRFYAYEYAAETLLDPAKQKVLGRVAAMFESFTLWVLNEGFDVASVQVPGLRVRAMPDPIPHRRDSPLLAAARLERSAFVTGSVPAGRRGLLMVGVQSARKGLRDIIRAAREVERLALPAHFLLSGRIAKGEEVLQPQVRALEPVLSTRNDYVDDAEILRTYNAADIVLLPYERGFSGSSGVFAHAMAFGKPVIATEHGCVGWRVKRFGLGLTYPSNDSAALVEAIRTMLAWSPAQWEETSARCRAYHDANDYEHALGAIRAEVTSGNSPTARSAVPLNRTQPAAPAEALAMNHHDPTSDQYSFELQSIDKIRQVCLLDTGIGSRNMGDHIIVDSIKRHLREIFPDAIFVTVPTHEYLGPESLKLIDSSEVRLVCGTNLLASHMDQYKQWKLGGLEFAALREVTLLGCGWWQYQEAPNAYTELLLNRILSGQTVHSVRDGYTLAKLNALNGKTVVNTTCPTLWSLTPQHLKAIPDSKGRDVVTTLTDYKAEPVADRFLLEHLAARYRNVYVWIQGTGDFTYLKKLASDLQASASASLRVVPATLEAYDRLLSSSLDLDYVGTRLHAGVRALQKKRRALILAVDNRAREISADTALPCIPRENAMRELEGLVDTFSARDIRLPTAAINRFVGQFAAASR